MMLSAARTVLRGRTFGYELSKSALRVAGKHKLFLRSSSSSSLPFFDSNKPLLMGCVCYDPSQQVQSLLNGHIDVAWNCPIAHVMTELACPSGKTVVSLGMRDVDRDFESLLVVKKEAGISKLEDLNGRVLYTGASDSPQAHVVPLYHLETVEKIQFGSVMAQDLDLGKHGDTALGEIKALEALARTTDKTPTGPDAAVLSKMMWDRALAGQIPSVDPALLTASWEVLETANLPKFDHCQFDALTTSDNNDDNKTEQLQGFGQALLDMEWENPEHQRLLKLEGIQKEWVQPRQTGYDVVRNALTARGGSSFPSPPITSSNLQYTKRSFSATNATAAAANTGESSTTSNKSPRRVAIIGAGVAGLQALRALKQAGIDATALEATSTVGGLWKSNYSNFGVQVSRSLYEFPDFPMTEVQRNDYATGAQVQSYTENYADEFGLRPSIRFHTQVKSAKLQKDDNDQTSWKVETTKDGKTDSETYDHVVVATGLFANGKKFVPSSLENHNNVLHSSDFTNASVANGKKVVVVGGGKSAVDCAIQASKAGASSVTWLQREPHWPTPRYIAGLIPFQYVFLSRFGQGLVSTYTGTLPETGWSVNAVRNSFIGPLLTKPILRLVEELFAFQFDLKGKLRPKPGVVEDLYDVALILDDEMKELKRAGKIDIQMGEVAEANNNCLKLKDGSALEDVDLVVSATGFHQDYSIFDEPTREDIGCFNEDGLYLYRGIVPEKVPNLSFIGHVACVSNILAYGLQAEWLARRLTGRMEAKSTEAMHSEIEARKQWARSWMRPTKVRGQTLMAHQTHYYDQLLKDMGENPHRKMPNILAEMFLPTEPADYNGIIGDGVAADSKASSPIQT